MYHINRTAPFNEYVSIVFEKHILGFIETYPSVRMPVSGYNYLLLLFIGQPDWNVIMGQIFLSYFQYAYYN